MRTEDYSAPVGFAREPRAERRRWLGRIFLFIFVGLVSWMLLTKVLSPPDDSNHPSPTSTQLPGPR